MTWDSGGVDMSSLGNRIFEAFLLIFLLSGGLFYIVIFEIVGAPQSSEPLNDICISYLIVGFPIAMAYVFFILYAGKEME